MKSEQIVQSMLTTACTRLAVKMYITYGFPLEFTLQELKKNDCYELRKGILLEYYINYRED